MLEEISKLMFHNTALENFKAVFDLETTGPDEPIRKKINSVLHSDEYPSTYEKAAKILEIQYFYRYEIFDPFPLPLDTILLLCERYSKLTIQTHELTLLGKLHTLHYHLRSKTLTKVGLREGFPEFADYYKGEIIFDPLKIWKNDYVKLKKEFYQSSDVVRILNKVKPPSVNAIVRKAEKLTHQEFISLCDQYYLFNEVDELDDRLEQCRLQTKFKVPLEATDLIRKIRKNFVTNQYFEVRLMEDLYSLLGLANFTRIKTFLWGGLKTEFIKICRTKNQSRLIALTQKYPQYAERILELYARRTSQPKKPITP